MSDSLTSDHTNTRTVNHKYSIRAYQMVDIYDMAELGDTFHKESAYSHIKFDRIKVQRMLREGLSDPYFLGLVIERDDGYIVGGLLARINTYYFSEQLGAFDLMILVNEAKHMAVPLIKKYIEWAKGFDVREICVGTTTRVNTVKAEKLFGAMGFERVGSVWKMQCN